jgi:hypothetical protein
MCLIGEGENEMREKILVGCGRVLKEYDLLQLLVQEFEATTSRVVCDVQYLVLYLNEERDKSHENKSKRHTD